MKDSNNGFNGIENIDLDIDDNVDKTEEPVKQHIKEASSTVSNKKKVEHISSATATASRNNSDNGFNGIEDIDLEPEDEDNFEVEETAKQSLPRLNVDSSNCQEKNNTASAIVKEDSQKQNGRNDDEMPHYKVETHGVGLSLFMKVIYGIIALLVVGFFIFGTDPIPSVFGNDGVVSSNKSSGGFFAHRRNIKDVAREAARESHNLKFASKDEINRAFKGKLVLWNEKKDEFLYGHNMLPDDIRATQNDVDGPIVVAVLTDYTDKNVGEWRNRKTGQTRIGYQRIANITLVAMPGCKVIGYTKVYGERPNNQISTKSKSDGPLYGASPDFKYWATSFPYLKYE